MSPCLCICAVFTACLPVATSSCLYSFDFVFGHVSQQITSWALLVNHSSMLRHEENLCLFVTYFVLRVYTMLHACWHVHRIHYLSCALRMAQDYSKTACRKEVLSLSLTTGVEIRVQGSLNTGKATSPPRRRSAKTKFPKTNCAPKTYFPRRIIAKTNFRRQIALWRWISPEGRGLNEQDGSDETMGRK